jgi:ABC-type multidrug transport system fused ATPase/permease subunit
MKKYLFWSKWGYALLILLSLLSAVLDSGIAIVIEILVNYISSPNFVVTTFWAYGGAAAIYSLAMIASFYCFDVYANWYLEEAVRRLNDDLFSSIMRRNGADFKKGGVSAYLSNLTTDSNHVTNHYLGPLVFLPGYCFTYLSALGISLYINWSVALILLSFSVLVFILPCLFNKPMNKKNLAIQENYGALSQVFRQFLEGHGVIRSAFALDYAMKKETDAELKATKSVWRQNRLSTGVSSLGNLLTTVMQLCVIVITGILTYNGKLGIGSVLAFIQLASNLYNPLGSFVNSLSSIKGMKDVNSKLVCIISDKPKPDNGHDIAFSSSLRIENLSFSYGKQAILSHFSHSFEKGKKYLILGPSGCGKSTLLSLIAGDSDDYQGSIKIDDDDYRTIGLNSIPKSVYLCEQNSIIFTGSLKDNIFLGAPLDKKKLRTVISNAGLFSFLNERGLDSPLDPELSASSGGETQRIALARAMYHDPKILLLDEITAGLDEVNNKKNPENHSFIRRYRYFCFAQCSEKSIERLQRSNFYGKNRRNG